MSEGEATPVRVRIRYPEYRWVMARGLGRPVSTADDREAELEFDVQDEPPFLRWLLTLRDKAEIVSPDETAEALEAMRQEVAALYA
jgi:predicted DNA-binding transcriptional regulator YafY